MIKKWVKDIRIKTKDMNQAEKVNYVMTYYWYHFLLFFLLLVCVILFFYHIGWGKKEKDFSLVLVNQQVDFDRDEKIAGEFSTYSGINNKKISVDSDYLISYDHVELQGTNESSYEKFFFNWSAGSLDAMMIPESFLQYCKKQNGEFMDLQEFLSQEEIKKYDEYYYQTDGIYEGIYLDKTKFACVLQCEKEDRLLLVFPQNTENRKNCRKFLQFLFQEKL